MRTWLYLPGRVTEPRHIASRCGLASRRAARGVAMAAAGPRRLGPEAPRPPKPPRRGPGRDSAAASRRPAPSAQCSFNKKYFLKNNPNPRLANSGLLAVSRLSIDDSCHALRIQRKD